MGGVIDTPWLLPVKGGGLAHVKLISVDRAKPHQASCGSPGQPCLAFLLNLRWTKSSQNQSNCICYLSVDNMSNTDFVMQRH